MDTPLNKPSAAARPGRARHTAPLESWPRPRWKLGVSRPDLEVDDLPEPEQALGLRRLGLEERILLLVGPAAIGVGLSIGSGEWMLGPLNVAQFGFRGIFWVVLISVVLQVFYNVELGRYTLATGESPLMGFGRVWPGAWLWIPLALLALYMSFILGGWTVSAGQSLFALVTARPLGPEDVAISRQIGIALLLSIFGLLLFGRKIERTLEIVQAAFIPYILLGLLMVSIVIVPGEYWGQALRGLLLPARPPAGTDVTLLGALAGFAALASGLNFMFIGYYRDKGYGMGARTGYLPGLFGGQAGTLHSTGKTFPENERSAAAWKRWFRLLLLDQWGLYFICVLLGMLLPSVLGGYLVSTSGMPANTLDPVTLIATLLGQRFGQLLAGWALIVGFAVLYSTQMVVLELLTRNLTEAVYLSSARLQDWTGNDPRWVYYPVMLGLIIVITAAIYISGLVIEQDLATRLSTISANMANLAAMIFPLLLIYLNRRLPRPARSSWWSTVVLVAMALFFGFFFVNFLSVQLTGAALVEF
ncbi:MAG: Nramp family divalent metal transporter [Chloroflexota bacterium]